MRASLGRDRVSFKASKIRDGLDFTFMVTTSFFFRLFCPSCGPKKTQKKMSKKKFLFLKQQSALLSFVSLMY